MKEAEEHVNELNEAAILPPGVIAKVTPDGERFGLFKMGQDGRLADLTKDDPEFDDAVRAEGQFRAARENQKIAKQQRFAIDATAVTKDEITQYFLGKGVLTTCKMCGLGKYSPTIYYDKPALTVMALAPGMKVAYWYFSVDCDHCHNMAYFLAGNIAQEIHQQRNAGNV